MEYVLIGIVSLGMAIAAGRALWSIGRSLRSVEWAKLKPSKAGLILYGVIALAVLAAITGEKSPPAPTCQDDLSCWGELHRIKAEVRCESRIEQLAKYDYDWNVGFGETVFSTWSWAGKDKNVLYYWGDKIKFQNGFGVYQTHTYACLYNPETEEVLSVNAAPGDLSRRRQ